MKLTKPQLSALVDCMVACIACGPLVPDFDATKNALLDLAKLKLVRKVKCGDGGSLIGYRITQAGKDAIAAS